ncbi:MAG: hypothetical protein JXQ75_19015 [Phycisphaerae bacterium]|nr:hypothetical protein [Phycisphaerae bacterium]
MARMHHDVRAVSAAADAVTSQTPILIAACDDYGNQPRLRTWQPEVKKTIQMMPAKNAIRLLPPVTR